MTSSISPAYTVCGQDGGTCPVSSPVSAAYYATDNTGSVYYRNPTTNFACNTTTFGGDPSSGHAKQCYTAPLPSDMATISATTKDPPTGFTLCSAENATCNPTQPTGASTPVPADILYGANGKYFYINAISAPCNDATFGDPSIGATKSCFYRFPATPIVNDTCPSGTSCQTGTTGTASSSCPAGSSCQTIPGITTRGLTQGEKWAIGLGVAVAVLLIIALIIYLVTRKKKGGKTIKIE